MDLPDLETVIQVGDVLVDCGCRAIAAPPEMVTLDIDDTLDVVHGYQQQSLFNAPALECKHVLRGYAETRYRRSPGSFALTNQTASTPSSAFTTPDTAAVKKTAALKDELAARGVTVSNNAVWLLLRREGLRSKKAVRI